ncbi:hypothetical protein GUJ93_ZPchr0008g14024 [Zizania palustris]|uniref:Uncharacterized protein n=1 Tax=Zizania palustris TaxID=103762 RepID=A0A8J5VGP7_ZIZPA|nr:hypothetical protein GUJ93_ZPchr0008g14024 [Zizania palustris]
MGPHKLDNWDGRVIDNGDHKDGKGIKATRTDFQMESKSDDSDFTTRRMRPQRSEHNKPFNEQKLEVAYFKGKIMRKEVVDNQGREIGGPSLKKVERSRQPNIRLRRQKNLVEEHEDEALEENRDKDFDPRDDAADEDFGAPVCDIVETQYADRANEESAGYH